MVPGQQPLPQRDQDKGDDCGLQEKEDRAEPPFSGLMTMLLVLFLVCIFPVTLLKCILILLISPWLRSGDMGKYMITYRTIVMPGQELIHLINTLLDTFLSQTPSHIPIIHMMAS